MARVTLSGDQYVLFVLLFKLGIMASFASALVTSSFFKRLIFLDRRNTRENWQFALIFGLVLTAGSAVRVLVGYEGVDLSLSGTFLVGLMGGMVPGSLVGFVVSLPGTLRGEWLSLPFIVLCGFVGGLIRRRSTRRDEFWDFSPFPLNNIVRSVRIFRDEGRVDSRAAILSSVLALEILRTVVAGVTVGVTATPILFTFGTGHWLVTLCVWLATLACVGIPLKIWNNTRVEVLLEEQRSAAVQARFDALRSQINPHFLFNTLNAATSSLWSDPERARHILVKLSNIFRRLLHGSEDFVPLSRELEFIDDYLSLEEARFGKDKIGVEKEIDPRSLDVPVPSMILQPLVENAIRHGLSPKIEGGAIRIEARRDGENLRLVIRDDGMGFSGEGRQGIGINNVRERLAFAYGTRAAFTIDSVPGKGTSVEITLPVERGLERG
ncbi:MAG: histidine kinase [bacterium]|nr:MAG: histidine kinase [bacterium]